MTGVNRVQIIGRLGSDPEVRSMSKGGQVCTFRVAVDRPRRSDNGKGQTLTDWFNIEAWGRLVYLEGRLQTDRYEQDGSVKFFTKVVVSTMQMLDRRNDQSPVEAE